MTNWSLSTELIALMLVVMLGLNLQRKRVMGRPLRLYWECLLLSGSTILWNITCVWLIRCAAWVPRWVNYVMNSLYYVLLLLLSSLIALYMFEKMLLHVYERYCICRAQIALTLSFAAMCVCVVANLFNGMLFYFDADGRYVRGPFYAIGYGIMLVQLGLLLFCFLRHRRSVSKDMKGMLRILPFLVVGLTAVQLCFPDMLLNGTLIAFTDVILYIGAQSRRDEVDNVTGLENRDSFFTELSLRIAGQQQIQIILISLCNFSLINRRYGHYKGNEFLYAIAAWIEQTFPEASAFRFVGVTYALVVPYTTAQDAEARVQAVHSRFESPWILGETSQLLPVVCCDMVHDTAQWSANEMMEILDYMLVIAKRTPRERVHFDNGLAADLFRRRYLADLLQTAVEQRRFEVWYQPIYCEIRHGFYSAEALVRMRDEMGRVISPAEFIPIAEEVGVIDRIFWFVLEDVCRMLRDRPGLPMTTVSINLSMPQFEDADLAQRIDAVCRGYGIAPSRIKFEITERTLAADTDRVRSGIQQLQQAGYRFYLDDFGTGYSNFATVLQYQFECVKLDRSLITDLQTDARYLAMARRLIELFHALGASVIAEGAEMRDQVQCLVGLGADRIQGFYYAKPMPEDALIQFLQEGAIGRFPC